MSWSHIRATTWSFRALPDVAMSMQSPMRHTSSRHAIAFQLGSRGTPMQYLQRRQISDSSSDIQARQVQVKPNSQPKPKANTSKDTAGGQGDHTTGQARKASEHEKHPASQGPLRSSELAPLVFGDLTGVSHDKSGLQLQLEGLDRPLHVSTLWLRDACACESCVNPSSGQKTFSTTDIPLHPQIDSYSLESNGDLRVVWANDFHSRRQKHESLYSKQFIDTNLLARKSSLSGFVTRITWNKAELESSLKPITYADWMAGGDAFARGFKDLLHYGILFLRDVPQKEFAVEDIAQQFHHLQSTFYGMTWDVVSKPKAENVAYTNVFLGLHHDLMYWKDVPKIQILHCLENSCDGGDSIFSDGLRAAREIQESKKEHFEILSNLRVPYHYDIAPHHYRQYRPVFYVSSRGFVKDIYWSPPFQAPFFALNHQPRYEREWTERNLARWRKAARGFKDNIEAPENVFQYKMKPGDCVLFDNRRVFHGRREFDTSSGKRWLKGGYISQEVLMSKATSLLNDGRL